MRLSIVIVNWNTTRLLEDCLRSIRQFPPLVEHEVIVVDNNSDDFRQGAFEHQFPDVKLIANLHNAGYAAGNNRAIQASTGDFVLLLNPDTRVTEGALESLVKFMELHPKAAAAGARLIRPDGTVDRSVRGFPYPGPIAWEFLGLAHLFPNSHTFGAYRMTWFDYKHAAEVDQPMGSCLAISRQAIEDIGLMDERFPIFFNDVDWLFRAKQNGYKVMFTPDATVIHVGAGSTSQVERRRMVRESHTSLMKFYKKHFRGRVFLPLYWFTIACIYISRLVRG